MTGKRYTRLKLKMLLLVVVGSLAASGVSLFLLDVLVDGILEDPFARFFVWVATSLFGQDRTGALDLYQHYVRNYKELYIVLGMIVLMLIAFYLAMGLFTRWLNQIAAATRQVVSQQRAEVHLPRELAPLEQDLNAIRIQLQAREEGLKEQEERRQDLVAFLAHDLKTPLTSVVGYLTLLRDNQTLTEAQRTKYTGIALAKAQRLEELLGEFFDITRLDLQCEEEDRTEIQLSVLLEQLADEFYPLFAEKKLTVETDIEPRLTVLGDPDKLARVFDNVLRNAVNYSMPDGQVKLLARRSAPWAMISICNEGLAIPEGELANIFHKFYRLDAARSTHTGGAGLGLAIAKEIVTLHGGDIRAESNGQLTSFVITLPLWENRT